MLRIFSAFFTRFDSLDFDFFILHFFASLLDIFFFLDFMDFARCSPEFFTFKIHNLEFIACRLGLEVGRQNCWFLDRSIAATAFFRLVALPPDPR